MNTNLNKSVLLRVLSLTLGSVIFAMFVPLQSEAVSAADRIPVTILVGAIGTVMLTLAGRRRRELRNWVALELNKVRRMYHISRNLSENDARFRPWFTDVHGYVYSYLSFFGGKDFGAYDDSNPAFRKLSYHIYSIPEPAGEKQSALFNDLLDTTGKVAEARQRISEIKKMRISGYGWLVFIITIFAFVLVILESTSDNMASRLVAGLSIAVGVLMLDLLWDLDSLESERVKLAKRYVENIARLELHSRN